MDEEMNGGMGANMGGMGGMGGMPRGTFKMSGNNMGGMNGNIDPSEILKMFFGGMGGMGGMGKGRSGNTQFFTSSGDGSGMDFEEMGGMGVFGGFGGFGNMGGMGGKQGAGKKTSFKFS